jgi:hypothetical protein
MHDKPKGDGADERATTATLDLRDQSVVLVQVLTIHPTQLRLSDLVREIGAGSADFAERDRVERAVRDLIGIGLLSRSGELVLPTRAALRFNEIVAAGV